MQAIHRSRSDDFKQVGPASIATPVHCLHANHAQEILPYIQNHTLIYLRNYVFTVNLAHTDKKNILLHMCLSLCLYQLFCNVFMYQHNIVCYEDYVKCFT